MIKQTFIFMISLTFAMSNVYAQQVYNQYDNDGKRHGKWKKNFEETKQVRYEGEFNHGKEVGEFRFYKLVKKKSILTATKMFHPETHIADVRFLASNGKTISEGKMDGRKYIGTWLYYHNNSDKIMTKELYNKEGLLHGDKFVYFKTGQIAEHLVLKNGKKEGNAKNYSEKGVILKEFNYHNGELHGAYKDYNADGILIVEGQFKQGKKKGVWKYYKDGKLLKEKDFSDPKSFSTNEN